MGSDLPNFASCHFFRRSMRDSLRERRSQLATSWNGVYPTWVGYVNVYRESSKNGQDQPTQYYWRVSIVVQGKAFHAYGNDWKSDRALAAICTTLAMKANNEANGSDA